MREIVAAALLVLGTGLLPTVATLRAQTPQSYSDPVCGFHFNYPAGWTRIVDDDRSVRVSSPDPEPTLFRFSYVRDIRPAAFAAAGMTAQDFRRALNLFGFSRYFDETLVWRDQFIAGALNGVYVVNQGVLAPTGTLLPYYVLTFFMTLDGTARDLGPEGISAVGSDAGIPLQRYRQMEPEIFAIVRSLRFTAPERACWPFR